MIDTSQITSWAVGIPSIGIIAVYGISIIRRRISSDMKNAEENKEYSNMLESYKVERDELKEDRDKMVERVAVVEAERNDAVSKVGKLSAEVEFLSKQVIDLKGLVEKFSASLEEARIEISRCSIENASLSAQVKYLENIVEQRKTPRGPRVI